MEHAILTAEQVWAKDSSNLQPSSLPEENAASSGTGRKDQCFLWKVILSLKDLLRELPFYLPV